jgi:transposase
MSGTILAIDLGKYKSVACVYRTGTEPAFHTLASNPEALLRLGRRHRPDVVVVEACLLAGWVHDLFVSAGFPCKVANTASEAWKFKHAKRKTDKDDALRLAQLEALGQLPAVAVPDPLTRQWRQLIAFRQKLVGQRVRVQNRVRALLVGRGLPQPVGHRAWTEEGMAQLEGHARALARCGPEESWRGLLALSLAEYRHLLGQIGQAEASLDAIGSADERVRRLRSIPGVGPRTAEAVVAYLDDAGRFSSGKEVSAYAGLVPRQHQSGECDRRGRITRRGPGLLRKLLVECAWAMLRYNGWARRGAEEAGGGGPGEEAAGALLGHAARRARLAGAARGGGGRGRITDKKSRRRGPVGITGDARGCVASARSFVYPAVDTPVSARGCPNEWAARRTGESGKARRRSEPQPE